MQESRDTPFPRSQGRFQQRGLPFPGTSPPGSSAHLGSTSSCQGPATLCQDRHTCTWGSGWRSEEQEGTGTHSRRWAGHSARRHLQLWAERDMERARRGTDRTCQVLPPPKDEVLPTRLNQNTFSATSIEHLPPLDLLFYPHICLMLTTLRVGCYAQTDKKKNKDCLKRTNLSKLYLL